MSSFKVGNSKFSRFVNGKGFYIALAICLVAIGTASYIAINGSIGTVAKIKSGSGASSENYAPSSSIPSWDNNSATTPTEKTVSGVADTRSSSSKPSSSSTPATSKPNQSQASKLVYMMPVEGTILTAYSGSNPVFDKTMQDWRVHDGVDIAGAEGTPVKACASGTVSEVKIDDMLGQEVVIDHGNGLKSIYANLTNQVTVKKGQHVDVGDTIGCIGDTAQAEIAVAPHLHFEFTKNGNDVDPLAQIGDEN
jgi:murein DD-endopeptidase MepM/ murein hydrolase activator NlpD